MKGSQQDAVRAANDGAAKHDEQVEKAKHMMMDLVEALGQWTLDGERLDDPVEAACFLAATATFHQIVRQCVPPEVAASAETLTGALRTLMKSIKIGPERSGAWKRSG